MEGCLDMNNKIYSFFTGSVLLFTLFFSGCGGGGGSTTTSTTTLSGQATLGPLSGSEIVLMDLNNSIIGTYAAKTDNADLDNAGSFSFTVESSKIPTAFLLVASGGKDIDPSDDGVMGSIVENNGSIHAILTIDDLKLKNLKINPLTEIIYQDTLNTYGSSLASLSKTNLETFLNKEAKIYLSDTNATYSDILTFNPRIDKGKSKINWGKVLSLLISGVHSGENPGTINERVRNLKGWLKSEGIYTGENNESIEQIQSDGSGGDRVITSITKADDNATVATLNQTLTTKNGEIINIYASKVNDTESYLRASVQKQGHEFSIEGKTTLLQGLSFDTNTIANFVGSLITVTDSNATAIQITIDKQLTNKISDHEVVLKIDGRKPTADELQTISDDPITAWSWTTTKQISGAALIKNYPIQNQNDTSITILKNGLTAIDIPKYRYDQITGIQSERLKILKKGISNLIFDAVTSIPVAAANILSLIVSGYSVASDLEFVVVDGIVTAIEGTPLVNTSRVALIGRFDNSNPDEPNRIIIGEEYYPVILIRAGNNKDKKTNNLIFSVHYGYDKSQYYNLGTITLKSNRGYIIIPNKTVSFTNKGALNVDQDLVFRVESSKGLLMSRESIYKVSMQGLLTIPTYYNTNTNGDTLWLWGDVLSLTPSPLLNYSWENDGHVIGTSKDMTINFKNLKIDSYGNTKITLNVLGPSGEKGTKTKIISLCESNEAYQNGTCGQKITSGKSALIVNSINNPDIVSKEFKKLMNGIDVIGADELKNGTKTLDGYGTISCFIYGGNSAVSNFTTNVLNEIESQVKNGATFVSNREVCGGKVLNAFGLYDYNALSNWYPALKDSAFIANYADNEPIFNGIAKYSGNPQDYDASHWDSGDYDNLVFRVDNSKSYTGRYGVSGIPKIEPTKYLASGYGTGWSVSTVAKQFPEWKIGSGKVIEVNYLNWTFDESNKNGGYIGIAGRKILQNIANGL